MEKEILRILIRDTLEQIGLCSDSAVELLMGTCAQESALGKYRRQIGGGPALGIMQMEPATYRDITKNYLRYKPELTRQILKVSGLKEMPEAEELVMNDRFAICMARVHYLRFKGAIPSNLEGWAHYWKVHYNTRFGKGTEVEFINNYNRYCA